MIFHSFLDNRLGTRASRSSISPSDPDAFENMSIPPPGVARTIPDLSSALLKSLQEVMENDDNDGDDDDEEEDKANLLGNELASKLSEPKADLMIGVVDMFGVDISLELFQRTQDIEAQVL